MADKPTSNKIPPWSSLTPADIKVLKELGVTKDSYLKDMKKFMESSESNERLDRQDPGDKSLVPLPKPRPTKPRLPSRTRSSTVEAKKGGLVTRKGPMKKGKK